MTFVENILHQMPQLSKPRFHFLVALFHALSCFVGRATMLNLSRYGAGSPRRLHRWFSQPFSWPSLNWMALESAGVCDHQLVACLDCTFLPKSGKKTWGLGKFHCGVTGQTERGLEACVVGLVDLQEHTAYSLAVEQTPAELDPEQSRVDFYIQTLLAQQEGLHAHGVTHVLADGYFAKTKVFDALGAHDLHSITKLRRDASLRYLYQGPRRQGRGRPQKYEGKVDWSDLSRFEQAQSRQEGVELRWAKLNSPQFKRELLVVVVLWEHQGKTRRQVLASTDLSLEPATLEAWYRARFQQEFVFRDAKQFTGLCDGQMLDRDKRREHLNAELRALNVMRLEERAQQQGKAEQGPRVISIASWKRRKLAEHMVQRITAHLNLTPEQQLILHDQSQWPALGLLAS